MKQFPKTLLALTLAVSVVSCTKRSARSPVPESPSTAVVPQANVPAEESDLDLSGLAVDENSRLDAIIAAKKAEMLALQASESEIKSFRRMLRLIALQGMGEPAGSAGRATILGNAVSTSCADGGNAGFFLCEAGAPAVSYADAVAVYHSINGIRSRLKTQDSARAELLAFAKASASDRASVSSFAIQLRNEPSSEAGPLAASFAAAPDSTARGLVASVVMKSQAADRDSNGGGSISLRLMAKSFSDVSLSAGEKSQIAGVLQSISSSSLRPVKINVTASIVLGDPARNNKPSVSQTLGKAGNLTGFKAMLAGTGPSLSNFQFDYGDAAPPFVVSLSTAWNENSWTSSGVTVSWTGNTVGRVLATELYKADDNSASCPILSGSSVSLVGWSPAGAFSYTPDDPHPQVGPQLRLNLSVAAGDNSVNNEQLAPLAKYVVVIKQYDPAKTMAQRDILAVSPCASAGTHKPSVQLSFSTTTKAGSATTWHPSASVTNNDTSRYFKLLKYTAANDCSGAQGTTDDPVSVTSSPSFFVSLPPISDSTSSIGASYRAALFDNSLASGQPLAVSSCVVPPAYVAPVVATNFKTFTGALVSNYMVISGQFRFTCSVTLTSSGTLPLNSQVSFAIRDEAGQPMLRRGENEGDAPYVENPTLVSVATNGTTVSLQSTVYLSYYTNLYAPAFCDAKLYDPAENLLDSRTAAISPTQQQAVYLYQPVQSNSIAVLTARNSCSVFMQSSNLLRPALKFQLKSSLGVVLEEQIVPPALDVNNPGVTFARTVVGAASGADVCSITPVHFDGAQITNATSKPFPARSITSVSTLVRSATSENPSQVTCSATIGNLGSKKIRYSLLNSAGQRLSDLLTNPDTGAPSYRHAYADTEQEFISSSFTSYQNSSSPRPISFASSSQDAVACSIEVYDSNADLTPEADPKPLSLEFAVSAPLTGYALVNFYDSDPVLILPVSRLDNDAYVGTTSVCRFVPQMFAGLPAANVGFLAEMYDSEGNRLADFDDQGTSNYYDTTTPGAGPVLSETGVPSPLVDNQETAVLFAYLQISSDHETSFSSSLPQAAYCKVTFTGGASGSFQVNAP